MQRRAATQNLNRQFPPHPHEANPCRAMVPVDGAGLRKKLKTDYAKALRNVEMARSQLDRYQQADLPQFTRWLNSHFGTLLTELRELGQQLVADEELIFLVEGEVLFGGGSFARAYQRVMARRENPVPVVDRDSERDKDGSRQESENVREEEDPIESLFNEIFGEMGSGGHGRDPRDHRAGQQSGSRPPARETERLKQIYRAVVRRLHPDAQQEMTAQTTEWWHQAQAAYEAGDAEQLEVILTLCEIGAHGTTDQISASRLHRTIAQMKSSLRGMKRQIAEWRRNPAWNFSKRTAHEALTLQMRYQLTSDLLGMKEQGRQLRERIAGWKSAAERLKPPRRRQSKPRNPESLF